jgi:lysine 2,3-aminomutase
MKDTSLDVTGGEPPDPWGSSVTATNPLYIEENCLAAFREAPEPESRTLARFEGTLIPFPGPTSGQKTRSFLRRYFPAATMRDWHDWRWQLKNRFTTLADISRVLSLSEDETRAIGLARSTLPLAVTPYYASLLDPDNPAQALRRCVVPTLGETARCAGEADDPLGEEDDSPTHGLVHRYPNRVLFLATDFCSTYCRYCTRSRGMGGQGRVENLKTRWEKALAYIEATPAVQDVLISGGDPLTLPEAAIEWLLKRLRRIPHVEIVRIGSKVPAVLPQRITKSLTRVLRRSHPLWISLHFTHPDELTPETQRACAMLSDAGIPLGSQTVLLAGINDDPAVMRKLFMGLLRLRVRPYYLYQCDPISGSAHFRTKVSKGIEIIRSLRGHISGYAVPTYVIDAPGGGGKIPVSPDYRLGYDDEDLLLTNYEGGLFRYPDSADRRQPPRDPAVLS